MVLAVLDGEPMAAARVDRAAARPPALEAARSWVRSRLERRVARRGGSRWTVEVERQQRGSCEANSGTFQLLRQHEMEREPALRPERRGWDPTCRTAPPSQRVRGVRLERYAVTRLGLC